MPNNLYMESEQKKVLKFNTDTETYRKLARQKLEQNRLGDALSFLFSALKNGDDTEVFADIAGVYSEMGLLEHSNKYWFKYLDRCSKEQCSLAYEEIAINYFYLDNLLASGYYFHKKVSVDGFISRENLDQEIIDFYSETINSKSSYYLAYPFDKADYSHKVKEAKRSMALADFVGAEKAFSSIPEQCLTEDASGDYALSLFLQKKDDKAIEVSKASLEKHGNNITALCSLSTIYRAKGDMEKGEYYYKEALKYRTGDKTEAYKLASCALDNGDTAVAGECLKVIIEERPFDVDMKYFYGISLINSGEYKKAERVLGEAFRTDPDDLVVEYFFRMALNLSSGDTDSEKNLPIKYIKELPKHVVTAYKRRIRDLVTAIEKGRKKFDESEYFRLVSWGLEQDDLPLAQKCVYLAVNYKGNKGRKILLKQLLSYSVSDKVKRAIVFWLIVTGYRDKMSVLTNNIMVSVRPAKLICDRDGIFGSLAVGGYALAVSKLIFYGYQETNKLAFAVNRIYGKLGRRIEEVVSSPELLAGLICSKINKPEFSDSKNLSLIFGFSEEELKETVQKYENFKGDKNDKNN